MIEFTFGTDGDFTLDALLRDLNRLKTSLHEADQMIAKGREVEYRVKKLSYNPHGAGIIDPILKVAGTDGDTEAPADAGADLVVRTMNQIRGEVAPDKYDLGALMRLQESTKGFADWIEVKTESGNTARMDSSIAVSIDKLLGPDFAAVGSYTGRIERINVHSDRNVFWLYPDVGPDKIECTFGKKLRKKAVEAVDCFVEVHGTIRYKSFGMHPYRIHVEDITKIEQGPIPLGNYPIDPEARGEDTIRGNRLAWQ